MKTVIFLTISFLFSSSVSHAQSVDNIVDYICKYYKNLAIVGIAAKNQISQHLGKPYKEWKGYANHDYPDYLNSERPLLPKHGSTGYLFSEKSNMIYLGCKFATPSVSVGTTQCWLERPITNEEEKYMETRLGECLPGHGGPQSSYFEWREALNGFENIASVPVATFNILVSAKSNFISVKVNGDPYKFDIYQRYLQSK
ncbi:hypothetical protein [Sneathiella sp.]|uniref:hypothetical protein n=1 Tax=Sneathiella sp. TaxID=1964365 RepID=UPI003564AE25